MYVYFKIS